MLLRGRWFIRIVSVIASMTSLLPVRASRGGVDVSFQQTNLVSSVMGLAPVTDPNLKNPWGISLSSGSPFWVSNQVTRTATLYNGAGQTQSLVVAISGTGGPTGQVFNNAGTFQLSNGANAVFLFATLDGRIEGWNNAAGTSAITMVDRVTAVYTGLAISGSGAGARLYAANAGAGVVDAYDSNFGLLANTFVDPNLPSGFTPYNIQNLGGTIFVTYENETSGGGVVDAFDLNGNLLRRVTSNTSGGTLDDPWGLAIAPASFGQFAGALLVGNEGNGRISAFNPTTGTFLGQLKDQNGTAIANPGLWGLTFGNNGSGGDASVLYFAAGIQNQTQGLFGSISAIVPEPTYAVAMFTALALVPRALRRRPI